MDENADRTRFNQREKAALQEQLDGLGGVAGIEEILGLPEGGFKTPTWGDVAALRTAAQAQMALLDRNTLDQAEEQ